MKAYTVNNRLVGVGNDQILGTGQGGGGGVEYEAGQYISIDENNVISVTGVAPATALPTTEFGKFTIQNNVSGGPIEVLIPTDQAPDSVVYQIDSVTGTAYSNSTAYGVINYYYGETPADFNGSDDSILFTINNNISNVSNVNFYYTNSADGMGGPGLSTTSISGGSTGILQSGTYKVKAQYNAAGTSSPYGKYLQIMFGWKNYASDAAQSLQWAQEALPKITFFGVVRPDPSLGATVNLSRYYLSNDVNSSTPSSNLACQVTVDPTSKQQKVYLPASMPTGWSSDIIQSFEYGNRNVYPSNWLYTTKQYRAYKYNSSTSRYQFAYCTDWDAANELMTFVAYDNSGNAIEKWTLDYSTWGSNVWTTEAIETGVEYTAGDYISIASGTISVTGVAPASAIPAAQVNSDWNANSGVAEILNKPTEIQLIAGANVQVEVTGASAIISAQGGGGGATYSAGQNISISNQNVIAVTGLAQADWNSSSGASQILNKPTEKNLVAGANVTITESNDDVIVQTTEIASGLQLVAGPGIVFTVSGSNLVAKADETVLYTASAASDSITTSEEVTHFERLRIELQSAQSTYVKNCLECKPDASNLVYTGTALIPAATYPLQLAGVRYTSSNAKNFTFSSATRMCYKVNGTYGDSTSTSFANSDIKDVGFITKIVGVNRISS